MSLWWCPGPVGDGNPCTVDICLPMFGAFYIPRAAGKTCSDGNACNGAEVCDGASACVAGAPLVVDDDNWCTADTCDPDLGVSHQPLANGTSCKPDGNACTTDSCMEGMCEHAAIDCNDGNDCTTDACDFELGCMRVANVGSACDDGDACTVSDACDASGECASGGALNCDNGAYCDGVETCDSGAGCVAGAPPTLTDGVDCTVDSCDEVADAVVHQPMDAICEDGDACTGVDHCDAALGCQVSGPFACALQIVSEPVTSVLVGSWSLPPQAVDLRLFTVSSVPVATPNWVVSSDGTTATEQAQTAWSYLVSNFEPITERFEADVVVSDGDDDFIGLGFGYQDHNRNYVMEWKAATQVWNDDGYSTLRGLSVRAIDNANNHPRNYAFPGGYQNTTELYFHDIGPWTSGIVYHLAVDFDPGVFTTSVARGSVVLDSTTIEDATYLTGRVALFNYEQANVKFQNVRRTVHAHSDYVYTVEAGGIDSGEHASFSLAEGPSGMTIDAETGRVFWQMSSRSVGMHPVSVRAVDGVGGTAEQNFTLEVVDAGPCYEAPAGPPCSAP